MNKAKSSPTFPGSIRIIGGNWRGRKLKTLESPGLRPTPNRIRETLFNWLQMWIEGKHCLDLFSGTGSLCLEALSRGAADAVMVEKNKNVLRILQENLAQFPNSHANIVMLDALTYLSGEAKQFDLVFVDPPFAQGEIIPPCLKKLCESWLAPGAKVYLEQNADNNVAREYIPTQLTLLKEKVTGQVHYSLYQHET